MEHFVSTSYPWLGTHVDWNSLPRSQGFHWGKASDAAAAAFFMRLAVARYVEVFLVLTPQAALRVSSFWLAHNLVSACCNAHQCFALGGAVKNPNRHALCELELGSSIWGHLA